MSKVDFKLEVINQINDALYELDLGDSKDRFVVIGGAAMAALGLKSLTETDIDIAVTDPLLSRLRHDDRWKGFPRTTDNYHTLLSEKQGVVKRIARYPDIHTIRGDVSALRMPIDDVYPVTSEELINESLVVASDAGEFRYAPLARVLDMKIALVRSDVYEGEVDKHVQDISTIVHYQRELRSAKKHKAKI